MAILSTDAADDGPCMRATPTECANEVPKAGNRSLFVCPFVPSFVCLFACLFVSLFASWLLSCLFASVCLVCFRISNFAFRAAVHFESLSIN